MDNDNKYYNSYCYYYYNYNYWADVVCALSSPGRV